MRIPLYKSRPVAPHPAAFGGERINDFIVLSEAFSNSYLLETPEGNIQVNAGMGIEAPVIKQNFDGFSDAPVRYLIFTQGHVDHVGGTAYLREQHPGLQVIATAHNPEHQSYDARLAAFRGNRSAFAFTEKFASAFEQYGAAGYTDFPEQDVPTPDILFEDEYRFTLGGLDVELIAVPGAETNDSLIIWLPQHRICLTGNLFGCPFGHFPNLVTIRGDRYRDALTVAAAVERVRALQPETILYGHHGPVHGAALIQAELTALHGAILHVHDATVQGMNEGKDLHTLMAEIDLPAEFEVGQGYGKVSWSVRAIWENYAGWFKHQSTTELYAVPQSSVHADLVELAGGTDAIVERAEDKLAQGKVEEAIHLLDLVSPADGRANAALRSAHERLLETSENFWLTSWLRNQLRVLAAAAGP
ncbi:MAG: MBL fold metallo-hydrolase [Halioglobus sp.]|nr:MBL fold metallo-hydrolase [Halioglobus sp.]